MWPFMNEINKKIVMNEKVRSFIWRIDLIEQAADDILKQSNLIEEDTCVVCHSEKPSVTFFPCGHKVFCSDCQKTSIENNSKVGCPFCKQTIMFYTVRSRVCSKTYVD